MADHMKHLQDIANKDVEGLKKSESEYGASWKKRGGIGAYMMMARKWDRIENALRPVGRKANMCPTDFEVAPWDILQALEVDLREEGILDDIRDLRRYLLLIESEALARSKERLEGERVEVSKTAGAQIDRSPLQ